MLLLLVLFDIQNIRLWKSIDRLCKSTHLECIGLHARKKEIQQKKTKLLFYYFTLLFSLQFIAVCCRVFKVQSWKKCHKLLKTPERIYRNWNADTTDTCSPPPYTLLINMWRKTIIYLFISSYRCYGTVVMADIADDDFLFHFSFSLCLCSKNKLDTYARIKNWIFVYTAKAVASSSKSGSSK